MMILWFPIGLIAVMMASTFVLALSDHSLHSTFSPCSCFLFFIIVVQFIGEWKDDWICFPIGLIAAMMAISSNSIWSFSSFCNNFNQFQSVCFWTQHISKAFQVNFVWNLLSSKHVPDFDNVNLLKHPAFLCWMIDKSWRIFH